MKLISNNTQKLNRALLFVGITIGIGFALQAPLLKADQNFNTIAGSMLAFKVLAILTFAGVIIAVFRLIGGRGNYETTLCAYLYVISPLYLFLLVLNVMNIGILSTYDRELAEGLVNGFSQVKFQNLVNAAPVTTILYVVALIFQAITPMLWFGICWGIFRSIHQVSKFRSSLAFIIIVILFYMVLIIWNFILTGLYGNTGPAIS